MKIRFNSKSWSYVLYMVYAVYADMIMDYYW